MGNKIFGTLLGLSLVSLSAPLALATPVDNSNNSDEVGNYVSAALTDYDHDGVLAKDDACPNTMSGDPVDKQGCNEGQITVYHSTLRYGSYEKGEFVHFEYDLNEIAQQSGIADVSVLKDIDNWRFFDRDKMSVTDNLLPKSTVENMGSDVVNSGKPGQYGWYIDDTTNKLILDAIIDNSVAATSPEGGLTDSGMVETQYGLQFVQPPSTEKPLGVTTPMYSIVLTTLNSRLHAEDIKSNLEVVGQINEPVEMLEEFKLPYYSVDYGFSDTLNDNAQSSSVLCDSKDLPEGLTIENVFSDAKDPRKPLLCKITGTVNKPIDTDFIYRLHYTVPAIPYKQPTFDGSLKSLFDQYIASAPYVEKTGHIKIVDPKTPEGHISTVEKTAEPTVEKTIEPTVEKTIEPTVEKTAEPTVEKTAEPTVEKTAEPTVEKTAEPEIFNNKGAITGEGFGENNMSLSLFGALLLSTSVLALFKSRQKR